MLRALALLVLLAGACAPERSRVNPLDPEMAGNDPDEDGLGEAGDNCPQHANGDQQNLDGDAAGDGCDPDRDGDGIDDGDDNCPIVANPNQADGDGVGTPCDPDEA